LKKTHKRERASKSSRIKRRVGKHTATASIQPTLILLNCTVHTMEPTRPTAEAIAIHNDRIITVGSTRDIRTLVGPKTEVMDMKGATVLPGFTDCHVHLIWYGRGLDWLHLNDVRSIDELKNRVAERSKQEVPWVLGWGWDQDRLMEKRYPTRFDLDEASPNKPVLLRRICGHASVANSIALKEAGIDENSVNPPGGVIEKDSSGSVTGLLRENAMDLMEKAVPRPTEEDYEKAVVAASEAAVRAGLTSVHCIISSESELKTLVKLGSAGRLPLRFYVLITPEQLSAAKKLGVQTGFGNERVRIGAVKIFTDGSLGARTAALEKPYDDDPTNRGVIIYSQEDLDKLVADIHNSGFQVAIHAIGDRAVGMALNSIEKATGSGPRNLRHRIEHASVLSKSLIERFRTLHVTASVQPHFIASDYWLKERLGTERASMSYPLASLIRAGVSVVAGSDCPIDPIEPLTCIPPAVDRPGSKEAIGVEEAIALYTRNASYASFEEKEKGTIAPGKYADLVALHQDPMKVEASDIADISVVMTMMGGRVVYQSPSFKPD